MKSKLFLILCGAVLLAGGASYAQPPAPHHPEAAEESRLDSLKLDVQKIEIGSEGIILKDKRGRILKIEDPSQLELRQLDSILKGTDLPKIEIEHLQAQMDSVRINIEMNQWDEETYGNSVVRFAQPILVSEGEVIDGDVVCIGCPITVSGHVNASAVAIGGNVSITNTGIVEGDAVAVGGQVIKHPAGKIGGENVSLGFIPIPSLVFARGAIPFLFLLLTLFSVFVGIISLALFPKHVGKVKVRLERGFLKCLVMGVIGQALFPLLLLILVVTIIGIPVALISIVLLAAALVLGGVAMGQYLGEKVGSESRRASTTATTSLLIGIGIIFLPLALWAVLDLTAIWAPVVGGFHLMLLFLLGISVWYLFITAGFGASILTRLGTRPKDIVVKPAAAPSQPPAPPTEPASTSAASPA